MQHSLEKDLKHILNHTETLWRELSGAHLFFTGGTGLFGVWLLEAMRWAQTQLNLKFKVTMLSRNPNLFLKQHPQFAGQKFLKFHTGDITNFVFPKDDYSHLIHGATTSAAETFNNEDVLKKYNTVANGTLRALEFAEQKAIQYFWLMSSGSAYGKQPSNMPLMLEDYNGSPTTTDAHSALGQGKRTAEFLCAVYGHKYSVQAKIARCFSFVGPHLPLDIHYAIGNFIGDGLAGRPITVRGTGLPVRSYLYMSDLVIWLMTIFLKGQNLKIYNVGSEDGRTIRNIAQTVAECFSPVAKVEMPQQPTSAPLTSASDLYVPSTLRAQNELGLKQWVTLEEGVRRTIEFYRATL